MSLLRFSLPCWVRMVLAFLAAGWVGLGAVRAGATKPLPPNHPPVPAAAAPAAPAGDGMDADAAAVLNQAAARAEQAGKPVDRAFVVSVVGEPEDAIPATPEALEEKTHAVALLLRCPVCQGSAVADSPSSTAVNMKNEVRDLVALGFGQNQILRYFEASYGQFVLMEPKAEGINWLVWLGPGVLVLAGLGVVAYTVKKLGAGKAGAVAGHVPGRGELPEDAELSRYVRKVRELAYGWSGGEPPADLAKGAE
ncbi:cytochrome c-type biogenesis protein CcmH [Vulgatibacter sp.]|uniref:cytochrome c-type biogenesis protein n=1 Tax=Vulgatibacter sp. TaxID=1971226 RepID=UPI003566A9C2